MCIQMDVDCVFTQCMCLTRNPSKQNDRKGMGNFMFFSMAFSGSNYSQNGAAYFLLYDYRVSGVFFTDYLWLGKYVHG